MGDGTGFNDSMVVAPENMARALSDKRSPLVRTEAALMEERNFLAHLFKEIDAGRDVRKQLVKHLKGNGVMDRRGRLRGSYGSKQN